MKPGRAITGASGKSICPKCNGEVTEPYEAGGFVVRRHKHRLKDGTKCSYGLTEGDPIPPKRR